MLLQNELVKNVANRVLKYIFVNLNIFSLLGDHVEVYFSAVGIATTLCTRFHPRFSRL